MKIKYMGNIKSFRYIWKSNTSSYLGKKINNDELERKINNINYLRTFVKIDDNNEVINICSSQLLSPMNFDVYAKYVYAKARILNIDNKFINKLYIEHIYAFNHFKDPDGSKNSKKDFINSFNYLIDEYKNNNINFDNIIIPISNQGILIDGSHRLSVALLNNQNINCVKLDIDDLCFNYEFFKKRKLKLQYLDYMALQIKDILPNVKCLVLEYSNKLEKDMIINDLYDKFDIYYIKDSKIDLGKLNILLDEEIFDNRISKVLFVILKGNNKKYNIISDINKVDILCKLFLNKNTIKFINNSKINDIVKIIDSVNGLDKNKIYRDYIEVDKNILEYNPKDIYYIKDIAFIKEK